MGWARLLEALALTAHPTEQVTPHEVYIGLINSSNDYQGAAHPINADIHLTNT